MRTGGRAHRRILGAAILLFWAVVVGMHVRREYFKPLGVRVEAGAGALAPGSHFYVVRMNGEAIGVGRTRFDTVASGFTFEDQLTIDVPALDTTHRAITQTRIDLDRRLQLNRFTFSLLSEIGRFDVAGVLRADSQLDIRLRAGGETQHNVLPASRTLLLDAAVPLRLAASGELAVGRTFANRIFDPSTLSERSADLRVIARDTLIVPDSAFWDVASKRFRPSSYDTIPVWQLEQQFGTIRVSSWIDEDGHLVKAESPLGFTLERTAYELADQAWKQSGGQRARRAGYGAVIEQTAIASNVDLTTDGAVGQLRVRLKGVELDGFDLAGGRQQLNGDTLTIVREADRQLRANYTLPYRSAPPEIASELAATPLIQSTDPQIVRTARRITGDAREPAAAARALNDWVYRELDKNITLSVPSALQVLEARQGDCNEHTVLFVALARAIGLPARTAVGLVHVRGRFYYHAWPEVYLNGWVAADPTLGQFPADAAHIRFLVGGLARQVELIRLIGRLELDVT